MLTREGKKIEGSKMVGRIVFAEPAFWDLLNSLGKQAGISRSEMFRAKAKRRCIDKAGSVKNIEGIDWKEAERTYI